uniref:SDR family oxidoreductase n=1 Tax=Panagrolaimus sp. PS1159 TaxID=55785 RepID=A0AC35GC15_9BILA
IKKTADLILDAGIPKERIHSVKGAVTDDSVLKALIDETISKFGKIDVLINNVGIAFKEGIKDHRSMENLDYVLHVNLKSIIHLTELAIPHLEKTKGNIVNVSSIGSQKTSIAFPFYVITKAALDHFARNYAAILAPKGIRVNNLNPGVTKTAFVSRHGFPEDAIEKAAKDMKIPIGRWGTSEEMGEFLIFMASEKASYMTGQIINVDGGSLIDSPTIKFD